MRKCAVCDKPVVSRYAKYCEKHRGGAGAINYEICPATSHLIKSAMMDGEESQYFHELAITHKLSEVARGQQEIYVHLFLTAINIRRESQKVFEGKGDPALLLKWIQTHASLSDKLGLTASRRAINSTDPFGIGDFMKGGNEDS